MDIIPGYLGQVFVAQYCDLMVIGGSHEIMLCRMLGMI
jgi:hypothetical protein